MNIDMENDTYYDEWDYIPIGAPFHSDIDSEKDKKPKDDNERDYVPIGAPFHHNND